VEARTVSDSAIELQYEEALRLCRKEGHIFYVGYESESGREVLVCERCNAVFEERDL
jgi:hypothetical protein